MATMDPWVLEQRRQEIIDELMQDRESVQDLSTLPKLEIISTPALSGSDMLNKIQSFGRGFRSKEENETIKPTLKSPGVSVTTTDDNFYTPRQGSLHYDTDAHKLKVWVSGEWVNVEKDEPAESHHHLDEKGGLSIRSNGHETMQFTSEGTLGMGDTQPSGKLHVKQSLCTGLADVADCGQLTISDFNATSSDIFIEGNSVKDQLNDANERIQMLEEKLFRMEETVGKLMSNRTTAPDELVVEGSSPGLTILSADSTGMIHFGETGPNGGRMEYNHQDDQLKIYPDIEDDLADVLRDEINKELATERLKEEKDIDDLRDNWQEAVEHMAETIRDEIDNDIINDIKKIVKKDEKDAYDHAMGGVEDGE